MSNPLPLHLSTWFVHSPKSRLKYLILSGYVMHEDEILLWLLVIVTIGSWWLFWGWGFFASMGSREKKIFGIVLFQAFNQFVFDMCTKLFYFVSFFLTLDLFGIFHREKKALRKRQDFLFKYPFCNSISKGISCWF